MRAIETDQLVHTYRHHVWETPKRALQGLDLAVEPGEIFGYLGANGAGKTTTLKILVGLLRPRGGAARLFGTPVERVESRRLVGFQPENPYFYEYLTARETLHYYAALCDVPRAVRRTRAEELLAFLDLRDAADVRVRDFSKGMRQRLGIAQTLVHEPRLVILDEPMSGLDPGGRRQVREALLAIKRRGVTILFSSHILGDVEAICDRVGLLVEGRLAACGPLHELLPAEAKAVELAVEGLSDAGADALARDARRSLREGALHHFAYPDWAAADRAVDAVRAEGGRLRRLQPVRESLEEYFMRSTGKSRAEVGRWSGGGDR